MLDASKDIVNGSGKRIQTFDLHDLTSGLKLALGNLRLESWLIVPFKYAIVKEPFIDHIRTRTIQPNFCCHPILVIQNN